MFEQTLPCDVTRQALLFYEGLGTPIALSASVMLRYGEWDGLAKLSVKPSQYTDALSYLRDAAAVSLLKKLQQLPGDDQRRSRAIEKWWQGERDCARTNLRLDRYLPENRIFFLEDAPRVPRIERFIRDIRKIIRSWLGAAPPDLVQGRFGPGATYSDRGGKTTVPDKMSTDPTLTRDAIYFLPQWLGNQWGAALAQRHGELSFVEGNRFATVPKTALIDRCIAAEPSINGFYQLALGRVLRRKLRKVGWDLDSAQEIHKRVACASSVSREFATLDLSNASDTVSRNLVRLLLPHSWHDQLDDLRSKKTLIDKHWVVLEKFSSMGNGYTFELETIIFAAIACVASRETGHAGTLGGDVFVFGDDIIVKDDVVRNLTAALKFFGFALNSDKSFHGDTPFRESCGGDYFDGRSVRPFFLKELPNEPTEYISFANGLHALNQRLDSCEFDVDLRAWFAVLDSLPSAIRSLRGPKGLGDVILWDKDETRHQIRWRDGIRYYKGLVAKKQKTVSWRYFHPDVVLACATYGTGDGCEGVIPRSSPQGYRIGWVPYS
jgi:hypothetical protein